MASNAGDHVPHVQRPGQGEPSEQGERDSPNGIGGDHHPPSVQPVAHHAADEEERDLGQGHGQAHHGEGGRTVGQLVDLPGQGDHEHPVAKEGDGHAGPQEPKIPVAERGDETPGQVMANLKKAGMRDFLEQLASDAEAAQD